MKARLAEGHHPDWDIDLSFGRVGEKLVADFLSGMLADEPGHITVEVKSDRQVVDTGNIWIEVQCRKRDGWDDSGIRTSKATAWAIVFDETCFITVATGVLRTIAEHAYDERTRVGRFMFRSEEKDGSHPTRGVKLPLILFLMRLRTELRRQRAA